MTADNLGPEPAMVLVRPQMGENIGAAARAMLNFGMTRMRIVAPPRDGWPNPAAVAMASGAGGRVLDAAQVHDDLAEAVGGDCDFVFATTARGGRDLTKPVYSPPERAMGGMAAEMRAQGRKVAVLFGPERTGLENDEVAKANAIISVPVNPEFASLNLAQCVLLTSYEWRRQATDVTHEDDGMAGGADWASAIEVEKLADHYEARLDEAGFFFPPPKAPGMKVTMRNMWSRFSMTRQDVQILHGALRQLLRGRS